MKKSVLYIATAMIVTSSLMWENPVVSYAEPAVNVSRVLEMPMQLTEEEVAAAESGPAVEAQRAREEAAAAEAAAKAAEEAAAAEANTRQNLVNYALQFVGKPYRSGGNDPHTGADCSGFVKYVMQHGAGITMNRTSSAQATQGRTISSSQMQPGDLIFYGNGSRVNHVAIFIGNGQIVHASTYKTGIKISKWNYREPLKIVSMFS